MLQRLHIGERYGKLILLDSKIVTLKSNAKAIKWHCICDCGNECNVLEADLLNGSTSSCGCLRKQRTAETNKRYNTFDITGEYGIGYTRNIDPTDLKHQRNYFYFDLEDYEKIKEICWCFNSNGYITSNVWDGERKKTQKILLHKFLLNIPFTRKTHVDHIHHNLYDNRKKELRITSPQHNSRNSKKPKNNTSGIKGVSFNKRTKRWAAYIGLNYKNIHLGLFDTFEEAVAARKEAEDKYYGEFSYENSMNLNTS